MPPMTKESVDDLTAFSHDDVLAVVCDEANTAARHCRQASYPMAHLLAGQPGAGKTVLSSMLIGSHEGNVFLINGDKYRRFHPHYRELYAAYGTESVSMTSAFSGAVTEALIDELSHRHFHLVIEGTGRTVDVPRQTAQLLASRGYGVRMAVIAARPELSLASTLLRFYNMSESGLLPRATAIEAHDQVVRVLPDNLNAINELPTVSKIEVWTREQQKIYDSRTDDNYPSAALRGYWQSQWTTREREYARSLVELLRDKENKLRLGQGNVIAEIDHRLRCAIGDAHRGAPELIEDDELDL